MDGWVVSVPLLRLSEVDQQFIRDHSPYLLTSTIISPAVRACERRSGDERGFRARSPENDPAWVGVPDTPVGILACDESRQGNAVVGP